MKTKKYWLACIFYFTLFGAIGFVSHAQNNDESFDFYSIDMINTESGWAIYFDHESFRFLHTNDAAQTWLDVTPPSELSADLIYPEGSYFFYDALHAWIYYAPELWYTEDGGQSWTLMGELNAYGYSTILSFVDTETGWLLGIDCCAASNEFVILYVTHDSGASWEIINSDDFQIIPPQGVNHDLTSSYHTGMSFADELHGWISLGSIGDWGGLLQTQDGGYSWNYVDYPLPPNTDYDENEARPCTFINPMAFSAASFAALGLCRSRDNQNNRIYTVNLYETEDGGESWLIHTLPLTNLYSPRSLFAFEIISPKLVWFSEIVYWDSEETVLHSSADGGESWSSLSSIGLGSHDGDYYVLDFVDEQYGWTINKDFDLLSTSDGGLSWVPVDADLVD